MSRPEGPATCGSMDATPTRPTPLPCRQLGHLADGCIVPAMRGKRAACRIATNTRPPNSGVPQKRSTRKREIARKHWGLRTLCACAACVYRPRRTGRAALGSRVEAVSAVKAAHPSKPRAYGRSTILPLRPDVIARGVCLQVFGVRRTRSPGNTGVLGSKPSACAHLLRNSG